MRWKPEQIFHAGDMPIHPIRVSPGVGDALVIKHDQARAFPNPLPSPRPEYLGREKEARHV